MVSCFIRGLKPEIGLPVKMLGPRTLAKTMSLTKKQEKTLIVQKQVFTGLLPHPKTFSKFSNATPSFTPHVTQNFKNSNPNLPKSVHSAVTSSKQSYKNAKILTPAEMDERRSKELCFNCDEKYIFGHVCKGKRQLFSLEIEDVEDITELEIAAWILLSVRLSWARSRSVS